MKRCTVCGKYKELEEFNRRSLSKDGRRYDCRECNNAYSASWQIKNPEKRKKHNYKWGQNNRSLKAANWAKYNAAKLERTPNWLSKEDIVEMRLVYYKAAALTSSTGIKHEVDHIIPLQGELISGLHVPSNLQILLKTENIHKSNKFELKSPYFT